MAITVCVSKGTACASQINLRDDANAKSRTFSALNFQVLVLVDLLFSLALASSGVTIITVLSTDFLAASKR